MDAQTPDPTVADLWSALDADPSALTHLQLDGSDPMLPSVFRIGTLASASLGALGLMAAELVRQRGGGRQAVRVDMRHALAMFRSERLLRINGQPPANPWSPLSGFYATEDGRWIQLHTNFDHHRDGVLRLLGCEDRRAAVEQAIAQWPGAELEHRLADAGLCAALVRSVDEWQSHAQARALADEPLVRIERIGSAPPRPLPGGEQPLSGVRVLELSRVIAGPVAGRSLAQHGAQVLAIGAAHLQQIDSVLPDLQRGKRSAHLDLRQPAQRDRLLALPAEADVFLQAFRPGALDRFGFDALSLAARRPGLIHVSINAYGQTGPWAGRRGYDSLVQSASGIADAEQRARGAARPLHLPCQALDHATGVLAALGAMTALHRRAEHGGSWRVQVSLARTGAWLQSLGRVPGGDHQAEPPLDAQLDGLEALGELHCVTPAEQLSRTPARLGAPPRPGGDNRAWW
jgi:crotonobetainyl-CoA:carnitine CoA-transferase CaiB-like acyl-CoA transferase